MQNNPNRLKAFWKELRRRKVLRSLAILDSMNLPHPKKP
jgi:hypothetical protein